MVISLQSSLDDEITSYWKLLFETLRVLPPNRNTPESNGRISVFGRVFWSQVRTATKSNVLSRPQPMNRGKLAPIQVRFIGRSSLAGLIYRPAASQYNVLPQTEMRPK
jgi:hypothetical protein